MLVDLEQSIIAYIQSVMSPLIPSLIVHAGAEPESLAQDKTYIHLQLTRAQENTALSGIGETVRTAASHHQYRRLAPLWLDCQFEIQVSVGESAQSEDSFFEQVQSPTQANALVLSKLVNLFEADVHALSGYLLGSFAQAENANEIHSMRFAGIALNDAKALCLHAYITASMHLFDEIFVGPPVLTSEISSFKSID